MIPLVSKLFMFVQVILFTLSYLARFLVLYSIRTVNFIVWPYKSNMVRLRCRQIEQR